MSNQLAWVDKVKVREDIITILKYAEVPLTINEIMQEVQDMNTDADNQGIRVQYLNVTNNLDQLAFEKKVHKFMSRLGSTKTTTYRML